MKEGGRKGNERGDRGKEKSEHSEKRDAPIWGDFWKTIFGK